MKPDIKAIKERYNLDGENICAACLIEEDLPTLLDYIADLEAVVKAVKKHNVIMEKWNEVISIPKYGHAGYIYRLAQEKDRLDDELTNALAKLDGDKDG